MKRVYVPPAHPRKKFDRLGLPDKFWHFVDVRGPGDCWVWLGCTNMGGYGQRWYKGKLTVTNRIVLMASGVDLKGMLSCHTCDFPPCCNPRHLYAGTSLDNARDRRERGRIGYLKGEDHGSSKITQAQAMRIKKEFHSRPFLRGSHRISVSGICKKYGISSSQVYKIAYGDLWSHLKEVS